MASLRGHKGIVALLEAHCNTASCSLQTYILKTSKGGRVRKGLAGEYKPSDNVEQGQNREPRFVKGR